MMSQSHRIRRVRRRTVDPFLRLAMEPLEQRVLLTVEPLTLAVEERFTGIADGISQFASVSRDGQVIAFQSSSNDLVPNDLNGQDDVYVYFRATGELQLISINANGTGTGNNASRNPAVSPDGRYVMFESLATDIIAGVGGFGATQLFARDLLTNTTFVVSANSDGESGNRASVNGVWSSDGTKVVFQSSASNLVTVDTNNQVDIFLRDLAAGTTIRVSEAQDGTEATTRSAFFGDLSSNPRISGNSRFVVFNSFADNLGPIDGTVTSDIYIKDLQTGAVELISIDTAGVNQPNSNPLPLSSQAISDDGRYVIFGSGASNLVPGPFNNSDKVFLRDRVNQTLSLVSILPNGNAVEGFAGVMTPDGRHVAFVSAGVLDPTVTDQNGDRDVFVRDLLTGTTRLVSVDRTGTKSGNSRSGYGYYPNVFTPEEPRISDDGRFISFASYASDLTSELDTNAQLDVFRRDLQLGITVAVSDGTAGLSTTNAASADLQTIVFERAVDPGIFANRAIVVANPDTGQQTVASIRSPQLPEEWMVGGGIVSTTPNGRYVAFHAGQTQDYAPDIAFRGFQTASSYVRDRRSGRIQVVDLTPDGMTAAGGFNPRLTPDGRFVVFTSRQPAGGSPPLVDGIAFVGPVGGFFSADVYLRDLATGTTRIVSVDPTGQFSDNGRGGGGETAVSDDGRYVAFTAAGDNLVSGITNPSGHLAIYQRDMWTNSTVLVSHNLANDGTISGPSSGFSMSPDGRYLVFTSRANDLVEGDANNVDDVFRWDRKTGNVTLVSRTPADDTPGNGLSGGQTGYLPRMTPDGRYIAFSSLASDLVAGDVNFQPDVFVRDMTTGTTSLVSINAAGNASGNGRSFWATITPDGKKIAFISSARNLTSVATNNDQVYVRDLTTGITELVSVTPAGAAANGTTSVSANSLDAPTFSRSGRYVAFRSLASNLVDGFVDANQFNGDVYIRDLQTDRTMLVTYGESGTTGAAGTNASSRFLFSDDESTLFFDSDATNLFPGDRNASFDVYAFHIAGHGQIQGIVFNDLDRDGTKDENEPGLVALPVYLDANGNHRIDRGETRLQTDASGHYAFTNLPAGTFEVRVILPDGLTATTPVVYPVTLASDDAIVGGRDFGGFEATVDLKVLTIDSPSRIDAGRPISITWSVANAASDPVAGDWQDAVYLSSDRVLDQTDVLLGTVAHTGGLGARSNYTRTESFAAPASRTGDYFVFVQTDRRGQIDLDTNRENNLAVSPQMLSLTIPTLTLNTPTTDRFTSANQDRYFQIDVEAGQSVELSLDSVAAAGGTELYARFGVPPTPFEFDVAAREFSQPDQRATIPLSRAGVYYVLARSRLGEAATSAFSITPSVAVFQVDRVSPSSGGDTGRVTVEIVGKRFSQATFPTLVRGGVTLDPLAVDYRDPTRLFATFDLAGAAIGVYDLRLHNGEDIAALPGSFQIVASSSNDEPLRVLINPPEFVRAGRNGRVVVEFENASDVDVPAPLLRVTAENAVLRLAGQLEFSDGEISFLGNSPDGPAGILAPGGRGAVELEFMSTGPVGQKIPFELLTTRSADAMDWESLRATLRPFHINEEAWNVIFDNLLLDVGSTVGEFEQQMADQASYLSSIGIYTPDLNRLLAMQLDQANGTLAGRGLTEPIDSLLATPGDEFTFRRLYMQPISARFHLGPFGRGWTHEWEREIVSPADGVKVVRVGDVYRAFYRGEDGVFRGSPGETAVLSPSGGGFLMTEKSGYISRYHNDGRFDFVADPRGNRITARYDATQRLDRLTHTSGAHIDLTYNAQGRIIQLTDSAGHTVAYSYDATGEHLTGYADAAGQHQYTYVADQVAARQHALASITLSDGRNVRFSYDARGRLIQVQPDNPEGLIDYSYPRGAAVVVNRAGAGPTAIYFDDGGQPARTVDALGNATDYHFDDDRNLQRIRLADAAEYLFDYDQRGNLVGITDPMYHTTSFEYDGQNRPTLFTDALGRSTRYEYTSTGRLARVDYANGTHRQFDYDASGRPTAATNRQGEVTRYESNASGQVTRKTLPDGTVIDYAYDASGRLQTVTNPSGAIQFDYNSLDIVSKVTYPDGKFLDYSYDQVGNRTRVVDQDGFAVNLTYDGYDRPKRLTDTAGKLLVEYEYDAAGRLQRQRNGNGTASTFSYDAAGQLVQISHLAADGGLNSRVDYSYDAVGRRVTSTLTDNDAATADGTTRYAYDSLGQLIFVARPDGRTIRYEYDAVGNRLAVHDGTVTTRYVVNAMNEYTRVGDTVFTYDADGHRISQSNASGLTAYQYDSAGRLQAIIGPGVDVQYHYDALGHRSAEQINDQTTRFLIDPLALWNAVAEYDAAGNLTANYVWGLGLAGRVDAAGQASFFDYDAVGNTMGLTAGDGDYVNRYDYLPFGESLLATETVANRFEFGGALGVMSQPNGLADMRYRQYDVATGRFVSNDPAGLGAGDTNTRRYAGNNPLNQVDPFGLGYFVGGGLGPFGSPPGHAANFVNGNPSIAGHTGYLTDDGRMYEFGLFGPFMGDPRDYTPSHLPPGHSIVDPTHYDDDIMEPIFHDLVPDNIDPFNKPFMLIDPRYRLFPSLNPDADPLGPDESNCHSVCQKARIIYRGSQGQTTPVGGFDPNDILGPAGAGPGRHILPDTTLDYTIRFENQKSATAPAQEVFVTHPLDDDLDLATFELGDVGFANVVIDVPHGLQSYATSVDYQNQDGTPLKVDISAELDAATRNVLWTFRSVDPNSGLLPEGVFDGFLPPNTESPIGEGFVSYSIRPSDGLPSGTRIEPEASIIFDVNEPIITPPVFNTIDAGIPSSQVDPLPETSPTQFNVTWSGTDEVGGSGVGTYDVFVSDNGGPFVPLLLGTPETSVAFTGQTGHTYRFYSVAIDLVGHREPAPVRSDAQTQVVGSPPGDFNGDGQINDVDIDLLCAAIRRGDENGDFDLDDSGSTNDADLTYLVKTILRTSFGDANVNGIFNSTDLIQVFLAGEYEDAVDNNSGWAEGDWNCDGDATSADLVVAFLDGGYVTTAIPWSSLVPIERVGQRAPTIADLNAQTQAMRLARSDSSRNSRLNDVNIDLLFAAIDRVDENRNFALDDHDTNDPAEVVLPAKNILRTPLGEANVDGVFSGTDLGPLVRPGQFEGVVDTDADVDSLLRPVVQT